MAEKKPQDALIAVGFIGLILLMLLSKIGIITIDGARLMGTSTPQRGLVSNTRGGSSQEIKKQEEDVLKSGQSVWMGKITLSPGSSRSQYQPYKEYITLATSGLKDEKVNITGWTLVNGKGTTPYQQNDGRVYYPSDSVKIPGAARIFVLDGVNTNSPVILERGSRVTLITGGLANNNNRYLNVTGFLVNKCSGYVENLPQFDFQPRLSSRYCPDPDQEVNLRGLEKSCRTFVENMQPCKTPEFPEWTMYNGELQRGCVDGVCGLTSQCKVMLKDTFSYNACVARHANDPDFYTKEWRVFLNQKWELWAQEDETITLFDNEGKVVDSVSW